MSELQSNLVLRDIRLIARMKCGWQFGHDTIDYFAQRKRTKIFADSLDQLLNKIDQQKSEKAQTQFTRNKAS